jgi:hypothetical protein
MSFTQFIGTAKCRVAEDFDMNEFLMACADWICNNVNCQEWALTVNQNQTVRWYEGRTHEAVCVDLSNYLQLNGNQLLIKVDSEILNTQVHNWLINRVLDFEMVGEIMTINSASIDSRTGVDVDVCYYTSERDYISSDAAIALLEQSVH